MQLKISVVTETYLPDVNGVANSLHKLLQALNSEQVCIQIIRTQAREDWQPMFSEINCKGLRIPMYPDLQIGLPAGRKINKSFKHFKPDIVFIATEGPLGHSALKQAEKLNIPVISAFHTNFHRYTGYYGFGWIKTLMLKWLRSFHNRTQMTLVPTAEIKAQLSLQNFNNVQVLPHAVDCEHFTPEKRSQTLREQWQVDESTKVLLYVGRVAAEKNIPLLLKTYASLQQTHKVKLVIVGDGPLKAELEKTHPDIIFCGVKTGEELAEHFASGDYFIFPSLTETFGLVTLEALASGLPVLAYDMAAAHMHIYQEVNGMTVKPEDEEAFVEAAHELLALDITNLKTAARNQAKALGWQQIGECFIAYCLPYAYQHKQRLPLEFINSSI